MDIEIELHNINDEVPSLYIEFKGPLNGIIVPIFQVEVVSREKAFEVLRELHCEELFSKNGPYTLNVYQLHYTERDELCEPELTYSYYKSPPHIAQVFWDLAIV